MRGSPPPLEDTCDATHALLEAPEGQRIERHAVELLSRALQSGRIVAFVGAGASMAYGRISWRDLVVAMQDRALAKRVPAGAVEAAGILSLLDKQKITPEKKANSEDYLTIFQLTEQLYRRLAAKTQSDGHHGPGNGRTDPGFRAEVTDLIRDDRGHAKKLLAEAGLALAEWEETLPAELDFRQQALFLRVLAHAKPAPLVTALRQFYQDGATNGPMVRPYHRFLTSVALSLLTEEQRLGLGSIGWGGDHDKSLQPSQGYGRSSFLSADRDPLMITFKLGIARFLTTNYDQEIERLLEFEGYRHEPAARASLPVQGSTRNDQLGWPWRDVVFDRRHVGHLLAFAAGDGRRSAEVVHLHGRAERGDVPGRLTVTEGDYQERYLAEDDRRTGMDDALATAFGGNPILFLGSGIGEDDLLRPLRQFVGSQSPVGGRLSIALVPADKPWTELELIKIRHLQRYGVYTIHYGRADGAGKRDVLTLDRISDWRRSLDEGLQAVSKDKAACRPMTDAHRELQSELYGITAIEGVPITPRGSFDLSCEFGLLGAAAAFCETTSDRPASAEEAKRLAKIHMRAVSGAMDSITGAFLSARLLRVRSDWAAWREDWLTIPEAEPPSTPTLRWFRENPEVPAAEETVIYQRHAVVLPPALPPPSDPHEKRHRFYAGAPSQTFNALMDSLALQFGHHAPAGRRIFLFISRRGVGKGHFFAALSAPRRLDELKAAIGVRGTSWAAAGFFNLSFSHEVATTIDQMTDLLLKVSGWLFSPHATTALMEGAERLAEWRLARLRFVLQELGRLASTPTHRRVIIAFNGISMLFDAEGRPKNAQVARLFELLVGPLSKSAPIDLILVSNETGLPLPFRTPQGIGFGAVQTSPLILLRRSVEGERHRALVEAQSRDLALVANSATTGQSYVHYLYGARTSVMLTAYFPSVALVVALECAAEMGADRVTQLAWPVMTPDHALLVRTGITDLVETVTGAGQKDRALLSNALFPALLAGAAVLTLRDRNWQAELLQKASALAPPMTLDTVHSKIAGLCGYDPAALERLAKRIDERMFQLFCAVGEGRFTLTLLMASAYEHLLPLVNRTQVETIDASGPIAACWRFLRGAELELQGLSRARREDKVIEMTLRLHADKANEPGWKLPASCPLSPGPMLSELLRTLLWHLAVVGQPVIAGVLARAPLVQAACERLDEAGVDSGEANVLEALKLLELRCLVFRVHTRRINRQSEIDADQRDGTDGDDDARWGLHRMLQRHIFARLHAPFIEYAEADQFSLTLYASQPNDVPRLSPAAHRDLYRTVSALIGFPEAETQGLKVSPWPVVPDCPPCAPVDVGWAMAVMNVRAALKLRAQILRAALGIIRSVYSLSSIARFDPQHGLGRSSESEPPALRRGFIEDHRLLVCWMLQQAARLDGLHRTLEVVLKHLRSAEETWPDDVKEAVKGKNLEAPGRPFYAEEIVWLYNECAVLSFAQGRIPDALDMFDRAEEAARRIEGSPSEPLRVRIALNRALAEIENGQLKQAQAAVSAIAAVTDEHPVVRLVAVGLQGLIDHVRGRQEAALRHYNHALRGGQYGVGLIALSKSRAAALFSKYEGDLHRAMGKLDSCEASLRQGLTLALEGGHEEVRHQVMLSLLRLEIRDDEQKGKPQKGRELHPKLDVVDQYAMRMGTPKLQAEADQLRTELLRQGGDLKTAASIASRGLMAASANDLRLRKTALLLRLAEIYADRELFEDSQPLLQAALEMARDTDFYSVFEKGQELHARVTRQAGVAG